MDDRAKIVLIYITFIILSVPVVIGYVLSSIITGVVSGVHKANNELKPKETTQELWKQFKEGEFDE